MSAPESWPPLFVAVTLALGDSLEDARASLGAEGWQKAERLVAQFSKGERPVRARALAAALAPMVAELELRRYA